MRIEFSLSADNYVESRKTEPAQLESRVAGVIAFFGLICLCIGYSILRNYPDCAELTGGIAIAAAFVLPLVAVGLWVVSTLHKPEKTNSTLRSTFERFLVGARTFEADDSGWKFSFGQSQASYAWADLVLMTTGKNTLIFYEISRGFLLPKEAASEDEIVYIRELCWKAVAPAQIIFSVPIVPTEAEYSGTMRLHNWTKRYWMMLALYGMGLITLCLIAPIVTDYFPGLPRPYLLLLLLLLPLGERFYYRRKFSVLRNRFHQRAEIGPDRICLATGSLRNKTEMRKILYRWIYEIRETRQAFMLYLSPTSFYIVPKAPFKQEEVPQFRNLLQSHRNTPPTTAAR